MKREELKEKIARSIAECMDIDDLVEYVITMELKAMENSTDEELLEFAEIHAIDVDEFEDLI